MTDSAEIVIVGGGIVGTAIAYFLARRGVGRDVLLLERDTVASGSTAYAVGGIREQFGTEINVRMSIESRSFWLRARETLGADLSYREMGYLFLARTDALRDTLARNVAMQNGLGVMSRLVDAEEISRIVPGLNVGDVLAASYLASDGRAMPVDAANAFLARAVEGGVRVRQGEEVVGIEVDGGRVRGVRTAKGRIEAGKVVNASGPWAGLVGKMAGVDVPVKPYRREIYVSETFPRDIIGDIPLVIDLASGWYFLRDGDGILMSGRKDSQSHFRQYVDRSDFPEIAALATERMPALAAAEFGKKVWAGLYEVSPDNHAILGEAPDVRGLYCACGFSGHGFQHSPATGRLMAELLLDGKTSGIDITPLGLERFKTGELIQENLTAFR